MFSVNNKSVGQAFKTKAPRWGTYDTIVPQFRKNAQPPHDETPVLSRAYNMNSWS